MKRFSWFNLTSITLGFAFLYIPIIILVAFSFNGGRNVAIWGGFSTKWYGELMQDEKFLHAAFITLRVAVATATFATILGTIAAYALVRGGRFYGRTLFSGMAYAPLVMPDVILGLSLLLLFKVMFSSAGMLTVILAHTTCTMSYVSVVVSSRLVSFDRSLEEAASDLGASAFDTFISVTLPNIAPAVISGWLLAFTLSLDDLVIASFTTGPGATTLPIEIFSEVRRGVKPQINALSTIMIGIVSIGVIAFSLFNKRQVAQRLRDEKRAEAEA